MADLRKRFIEDYAGGLLNISRQEISTAGEVLSQDGLTSEGTILVEDGSGVKTGLKLGVSLAEAVDPTTEEGVVNVRFAERTYAKVRDLKVFSTAIASAQAALSRATSVSMTNLENALQLIEDDLSTVNQNFQESLSREQEQIRDISLVNKSIDERITTQEASLLSLANRVSILEPPSASIKTIEPLPTGSNRIYYEGTIAAALGIVTGTNTELMDIFEVGDRFVSTDATGRRTQFTVTGFDSATPQTRIFVTPTNVTIASGSRYERDLDSEIRNKINETLLALRGLGLIL